MQAFVSGFFLSMSLIVAIGAQNAFVLRQGLLRQHVGPVVVFCALADALLMSVGVLAASSVQRVLPWLAPAMTVAGAAFLLVYGAMALRRAASDHHMTVATQGDGKPPALRTVLAQTAAFTLLNPHVYLDTVVLVGTVGARQEGEVGRLVFLAGSALGSACWFVALGFGARWLAPWFAQARAWRRLDAGVGVVMLLLAAGLLLSLRQAP